MSANRALVIGLRILIVIILLAGGGFALYRLGYAHGLQHADVLPVEGRMSPDLHRGFLSGFWFGSGRLGATPLQILSGPMFVLGMLALVVIATTSVIQLVMPRPETHPKLPRDPVPPEPLAEEDPPSGPGDVP